MKHNVIINSSTGGTGGETLRKHFWLTNTDNFESLYAQAYVHELKYH